MKDVKFISPFKRLCVTVGNLPTAYIESMSYYEALTYFMKFLENTVIPAINSDGEAITELQEKYIELKEYVDNYFENLDIQTEIDNKLDEMADNGTLAEIIEDYATIPELTTEIENAQSDIADLQKGLLNDEIVIVGDSYLAGQSLTNPATENFGYLLMQKLGMNSSNFHIWAEGGSSFTNPGNQGHTWKTLVESKLSTVTTTNITKVILAGGYNDITALSEATINTAMSECIAYCKTSFPNAKIYLYLIGNNGANSSNGANARSLLKNRIYNVYSKCYNYGAIFLDKGQLTIQNYNLYENNSTAVHPNANGHQAIANLLYQELMNGSCDYTINIEPYNGTLPDDFTGTIIFAEKLINNKVELMFYTSLVGEISTNEVDLDLGEQALTLIKYNSIASGNSSSTGLIRIGNSITNIYHTTPAKFYVDSDNKLHLQFQNDYENIDKIISNWNSFDFDVNKI